MAKQTNKKKVWINPYKKKDGTRVSGHWRLVEIDIGTPTWSPIDINAKFKRK